MGDGVFSGFYAANGFRDWVWLRGAGRCFQDSPWGEPWELGRNINDNPEHLRLPVLPVREQPRLIPYVADLQKHDHPRLDPRAP